MKSFTYLTHKFEPLGRLPKNFDFFEVTGKCRSIGISNYNGGEYSHSEFYAEAMKVGGGEVDIFLLNDEMVVLPCENELFKYGGKWKEIEDISESG